MKKESVSAQELTENYALPDYPTRIYSMDSGHELLLDKGEKLRLAAGKILVEQGDPVKYCYVVVSGRVISMEYTLDGAERIFNMFDVGSLFLESNVLLQSPAAVCFKALTNTELIRITKQQLLEAMMRDEKVLLAVVGSTAYKYFSAMDQIRESFDHNASWRIYNLFMIFASNYGEDDGNWIRINMKLNHQMIGNLLGMNRVTVSKLIKEMKNQGLIRQVNDCYCVQKVPRYTLS